MEHDSQFGQKWRLGLDLGRIDDTFKALLKMSHDQYININTVTSAIIYFEFLSFISINDQTNPSVCLVTSLLV